MSDPVLELIQKQGLEYKSSGRDYQVRCLNPEHPDASPSMRIDRVTGVFNCFSCSYKGNIFKFYGVFTNPIPIRIAKLKEKLSDLKNMVNGVPLPDGATPYTSKFRGISTKTLKHFGAFYTHKVSALEDRVVFPINDITGKAQVYVGRHTFSNGNPRYVNYPAKAEMPVYPARVPSGYHSLVLVEGIFDMLNLYDKGLTNVACAFGTKTIISDLKPKMLPFKAQGVTHIFIVFDGDEAGAKGAELLKPMLEELEFIVEIVTLPEKTDPGELGQEDVDSLIEYTKR
jgi:DNA primase